jgi:hypothetical protein
MYATLAQTWKSRTKYHEATKIFCLFFPYLIHGLNDSSGNKMMYLRFWILLKQSLCFPRHPSCRMRWQYLGLLLWYFSWQKAKLAIQTYQRRGEVSIDLWLQVCSNSLAQYQSILSKLLCYHQPDPKYLTVQSLESPKSRCLG